MQIHQNLYEMGLHATSSGKGSSKVPPAKPLYFEAQHMYQQR